jgi:hypothetical protein
VGPVGRLNLGCDFDRHALSVRDFDGTIAAFCKRDAHQKGQLVELMPQGINPGLLSGYNTLPPDG